MSLTKPASKRRAGDGRSGGSSNLMRARKREDVMAREFGAAFQRILWLSALALAFAVLGAWPMNAAKAQVIERGVQGGVVGAIIGGIVGGGRGAAPVLPLAPASASSPAQRKPTPMRALLRQPVLWCAASAARRIGPRLQHPDLAGAARLRSGAARRCLWPTARPMRSVSISTPTVCPSTAGPRRNCSTS